MASKFDKITLTGSVGIMALERADFVRQSFLSFVHCLQERLREKPSSLFILLGWSSVSVTSLKMHSMCLDFLALNVDAVT
jgi:hypothetical protein